MTGTEPLPDLLFPYLSEPLVIVAISGGSDSTALLLLARDAIRQSGPSVRLLAATVDHQLRPGSRAEAEAVARLCARLGIEHRLLPWSGDKPATGISATARLARHRLLADLARREGGRLVLTGHTADDQAETVLMRAERGQGIGLAGIAPATVFEAEVFFARPLLGVRRADLRRYLRWRGTDWIDDPSNDNDDFERVRVRKALAAVQDREQKIEAALALSAETARERQRLADAAAALIRKSASLHAPDAIQLGDQLLREADRAAAVHTLRALLATVGGLEHLPDLARTQALYDWLVEGEGEKTSLARTVVAHRRGRITLMRERRGVAWDQRDTDVSPGTAPLSVPLPPPSAVLDERPGLTEMPPHPASASLGHPLPAGERRFSPLAPRLPEGRRQMASTVTTSSPQRGEGGRAKRRPGEGALPAGLDGQDATILHGRSLRSPWVQFLPSFDIELARAVAELLEESPPPALPWP